jgi:plastocyanin
LRCFVFIFSLFVASYAHAASQMVSAAVTGPQTSALPQRMPTRRPALVSGFGKPPSSSQHSVSLATKQGNTAAPAVAAAVSTYPTGLGPFFSTTAILRTGSGKTDIIVSNSDFVQNTFGPSNTITILPGNGDGTFATPVNLTICNNPAGIAAADFNGDGNVDLAVACAGSNQVAILLGIGDGTFQSPSFVTVGSNPVGIVSGNFFGNNRQDLVVTNSGAFSGAAGTISILKNNGSGQFTVTNTLSSGGTTPLGIAIADFGNGHPDIAVANTNINELSNGVSNVALFLNNGTGTFTATTPLAVPAGDEPFWIVAGRFADKTNSNIDLVISDNDNMSSSGDICFFAGNGNGTFQQPCVVSDTGIGAQGLAAADFNHDGHLDLITTGNLSKAISIVLGNGDGTFQLPTTLFVGQHDQGEPAIADFNNDGNMDFAVAQDNKDSLGNVLNGDEAIFLGDGTGGFSGVAPITYNINVNSNAFSPNVSNIKVGDTLLWVWNSSSGPHSTTEGICPAGNCYSINDDWDSGLISQPGTTFFVTFYQTGTFTYYDRQLGAAMTGTINVVKSPSATTVQLPSSDGGSIPSGTPITIDALVDGGSNSGSVTFTDTFNGVSTTLGTGDLFPVSGSESEAFLTISTPLAVGTHNFTAVYAGDAGTFGSTSTPVPLNIGPPTFQNVVTLSPAQWRVASAGSTKQFHAFAAYGDGSTADITNQVLWASADPTVVSVSPSGLATAMGPGTTTVEATYNQVIYPATFVVGADYPLSAFGTSISESPNVAFTQTVASFTDVDPSPVLSNFTATINWGDSSPNSAGTIVGSGTPGTFNVQGTHTYSGIGSFGIAVTITDSAGSTAGASSSALVLNPTSLALNSSANPSLNQPVTFTATVTAASGTPTGSVDFQNLTTGIDLGSATLSSGTASVTANANQLSDGEDIITASYPGDGTTFAPSQNSIPQLVNEADVGVTASFAPNPISAGGTTVLTVTITNNGPATANNVTIINTNLPFFGGIFDGATTQSLCPGFLLTSFACNIGSLAPSGVATLTMSLVVDGPYSNTPASFSVSADEIDTNSANNTANANLTVNPGTTTHLQMVSGCARPGDPFGISVIANDAQSNVDPTYAGTVRLTSSDPNFIPFNFTFNSSADSGIHSLNNAITLQAPGSQTITATDTSNASITGTATVVVGNANGCFKPGLIDRIAGNDLYSNAVVADLNGDGKPDLIAGTTNGIVTMIGNGDGTFQAPSTIALGISSNPQTPDPAGVVVGDFNNDGKLDVVAAGNFEFGVSAVQQATLAVLLGNGDGTFQSATFSGSGPVGRAIVSGDFNRDGKLDVAYIDQAGELNVFLGNGGGTFQQLPSAFVSAFGFSRPDRIVVADFNNDGAPDIAISDYAFGNVYVLLGNGDGTFQAPQVYSSLSYGGPFDIIAGDFNRDGKIDLAVANIVENSIQVYLGNGDGTFKAPVSYPTGPEPFSVAALDMNHDGKLDLVIDAIGGLANNNSQILIGNGDGTFQAATEIGTSSPIGGRIAIGDLNRDGAPDVFFYGGLSLPAGLLLNVGNSNGNPAFSPPMSVPAGGSSSSDALVVGDFDHDGILDIASAYNDGSGTIGVMLGQTDGTFVLKQTLSSPVKTPATGALAEGQLCVKVSACGTLAGKTYLAESDPTNNVVDVFSWNGTGFNSPTAYSLAGAGGSSPGPVAIADLDGDGIPDIIVGYGTAGSGVAILFGSFNGDGTFQIPAVGVSNAGGIVQALAVGNLCVVSACGPNEGKADYVLITNSSTAPVQVFLGNGLSRQFTLKTTYTANISPSSVAIADVNRDGIPDLIVGNGGSNDISVLLGNGDGTFKPAVNYPVAAGTLVPSSVEVADLNGDGKPDLMVTGSSGSNLSVLYGNGDGTFETAISYPANQGAVAAIAADINRDGIPDIVVANDSPGGPGASVLLAIPNSLQVGGNYSSGGGAPDAVATADFNGDGKADIAVVNSATNNVTIRLGNGNGSFSPTPAASYTVGSNPVAIATGDFNGDGKPDLAIANKNSSNVSVLVNTSNATAVSFMQKSFTTGAGTAPADLVVGDFNGDNKLDLAVTDSASGNVIVLNGNGDGTFGAPHNFAVAIRPAGSNGANAGTVGLGGVASGDLNGDKKPDLVVTDPGTNRVSVLINTGTGFAPPVNYPVGTAPIAVTIADFNGDGFNDIAVANSASNNVTVLFNDGTGVFNNPKFPPATLNVGKNPGAIIAFDYNGDGKADIATSNTGDNTISVLVGNGDGTFQPALSLVVGTGPADLVAGNFSGSGSDLITANGSGNSVSVVLNSRGAAMNALTSSAPAVYGVPVTFTVNMSSTVRGQTAPTGSVTFKNGAAVLQSAVPLKDGSASYTTGPTTLSVGTHTINISYSGDSGYNPATAPLTQVVNKAPSTATLSSSANPSGLGQTVTFTATISSTVPGASGTVTFKNGSTVISGCSSVPVSANSASCSTSFSTKQTYSISATYSGDGNFQASPLASISQIVERAASSTALASSSSGNVSYGTSLTFTATVSSTVSTTGNVTFMDGPIALATVPLSAGTAHYTSNTLAVGPHTISAQYPGDTNNSASASTVTNLTIGKALPGFTITSSPNPSQQGTAVTFSIVVAGAAGATPPIGNVTFKDGNIALQNSTSSLSSGTTSYLDSNLQAGVHTITATYGGDLNYQGASGSVVQVVDLLPPANIALAACKGTNCAAPVTIRRGEQVALTANISSTTAGTPTGTVTFYDGAKQLGPALSSPFNTSGCAPAALACVTSPPLNLTVGDHVITAIYSGDNTYGGNISLSVEVRRTPLPPTPNQP